MEEKRRFHSVRLEKDKCKACTNCLKRCPTEAIRVRGGRAHIIDERCIDCGECIRVCEYHAKIAVTDPLSSISQFKYKIALPAPSLYGQFKNLRSIAQVLTGLKHMGFDEVFEVARGADVVTRAIREKLRQPDLPKPLISAACPAIVRLIQVRFPDLIDHIVDIRQPMEVAALIAKREFARKHDVPESEIGCFFITPCPAKVTAIRNPIGHEQSAVDGAISVLEIYGLLSSHTKGHDTDDSLVQATSWGVGWANSGGEANAVCPENSMAVDGIENVIRVLEEIENNKLHDLTFFEGSACTGGCVGGPLNFENNYVARNMIRRLVDRDSDLHPEHQVDVSMLTKYPLYNQKDIMPNSAMKLDDDIVEAMRKMERIEDIFKRLPGYDCGSCGSPTCRTFAEDIVQGFATDMDCIHKLKEQLKIMAQQMVNLAQTTRE
ncbi:MAG: 4Fe-4S dicluster domain-containing protein [Clostridia bacterium]|nr:4Fe-4S dicluster domain-containing protein [Clostridia bacterium]